MEPHKSLEFSSIHTEVQQLEDNSFLTCFTPENYAVIYARQSIKKSTNSIESQIESCKKRLKKENFILYDVYYDRESGRKIPFDERKNFKRLLNDLKAGMFKNIIITRRDRLTRSMEDFMKIRKIFQKNDINVIYANEGEFDKSNQSYISNFIENIIMAIGTLEPENINERTTRGKKIARENGKYSSGQYVPLGFVKTKNKLYKRDEIEASLIKLIFENYLKLDSNIHNDEKFMMQDLLKIINDYTNKHKIINKRTKEILTFYHQKVYSTIEKPVYAKYILKDAKVPLVETIYWDNKANNYKVNFKDFYVETSNTDRIIDKGTWEKAIIKHFESKLDSPIEPKNYLFKNILYCSSCKGKVKLLENKYQCPNGCIELEPLLLFKKITNKILLDIDVDIIRDILIPKLKQANIELNNLRSKMKINEKQLRRNLDIYIEDPGDEIIQKEISSIKQEQKDLKLKVNDLGEKLDSLDYKINNLDFFKIELTDHFNELSSEYLNNNWELINTLITKFCVKVVLRKYSNKNGYSVKVKYNN
ncbi:recombinase family protein [Sporosalibacterium faouarense]|uniref:recombinase family protein n=1 Tax=Sporosalibacterium faouarense TaxID=516123 RepID=UPI00192BE58F|nr:recombinase family protein [Sporosalibacterium faouarense]